METVKVKGHAIHAIKIKDSFLRRAVKYKNDIISQLKMLGITEDDILLDLEPAVIKPLPATVVWYFDYNRLEFSCKSQSKYVENLYIISKVIQKELELVAHGEKTIQQFVLDFTESDSVAEDRKLARELLGVEEDCLDLNHINKVYKKKAMSLHPDVEGGDHLQFQELNRAHKILKRELE